MINQLIGLLQMKNIQGQIQAFFKENPSTKDSPNYRQMKNGILPLRVGFNQNRQPSQSYPTIQIDNGEKQFYSALSESYPADNAFKDIFEIEPNDPDTEICDHIVEESIRAVSLRVRQNKFNEIKKIEDELSEIVQTGAVDVGSFSSNSITNLTTYDIHGNPIGIGNIMIDPSTKRYVEWMKDELLIYSKLPHPIRQKKKKRVKIVINKKSEREVMEEFDILNGMFQSQSLILDDKQNTQKIMDAVNLVDTSYQNLWQKIVGEIKIENKDEFKIKTQQVSEKMNDAEFDKAIDRIMTEAIEYEKEAFDVESEQEQEEEYQQLMEEKKEEKKEEELLPAFDKAKIEKKVQLKPSSRYQFAVEDNSDLTNFYDVLPKQMFATSYSFELDEFQKRSILHLENKESVFVAAHTSAGKTVVAEYGIALAIKHKRKVIYTSPIKALSNQKYRELSIKFGAANVGIVTGDVSMNQQANCVIMTTQILRNNLYRGTEMIRDIEWVIFDEVHYINNQERGVVWEETIIMLPQHIGIIMLSATVPNYMDFANWVGRTKHRIIYVMKTLHRPVPLEHSLYIFSQFHVIKSADGRFLRDEYNDLHTLINTTHTDADIRNKALKEQKKKKIEERGFYNDERREQRIKMMNKNAVDKFIKKITRSDMETADGRDQHRVLEELIVHCNKKKLLPCVVFTFSKKKINSLAGKLFTYDLTVKNEKSKIAQLFASALSNLKPEDREIDQFQFLYAICMNGYAVHHGDLLPLAKQIVQILFSQGLIKVLFATETFAMGINMPAKTVIFNSIKKVTDSGGLLRFLNSSQYVQMSGRAGRRGLDEKGTVIIVVKNPENLPKTAEMEKMVDHPGERLSSKFRVTYQIILNLLNSSEFGVTEMMRQSFLENPKFSEFTANVKSLKQYQQQYAKLSEFECPFNKLGTRILIDQYITNAKQIKAENEMNIDHQFQQKNAQKSLPKFAKILGLNYEVVIGLILRIDLERSKVSNKYVQVMIVNRMMLDHEIDKEDREQMEKALGIKKRVILEYDEDRKQNNNKFYSGEVPGTNNDYHYYVSWVEPGMIVEVYTNKIGARFGFEEKKESFQEVSIELLKIPENLVPFPDISKRKQQLWKLFETSPCHDCSMKEKHHHQYDRRLEVKDRLSECAKKLDTNELGLMGSFEGMILLLASFGFLSQSTKQDGSVINVLTLKGRIAKEVDIYVAETIIEAVLDPLDPPEIAALMSAFVCDYKPRPSRNQQEEIITPIPKNVTFTTALTKAIGKTYRIVQNITKQEQELQAYVNLTANSMEEHVMSIVNFHLSDTVYKWAIGFDFNDAKEGSKAPQGTIVRTILRLSQLLSNTKSVCRIIGNSELQAKIQQALQAIKRDIVFCQSLYLTG